MSEPQEFNPGSDFGRPTFGEYRSSANRAKPWDGESGYVENKTRSRKHALYEVAEGSNPADGNPLNKMGKSYDGPILQESNSTPSLREPLGKPSTDTAASASSATLKNATNSIPASSSYVPKESVFIQIDGADGIRRLVPKRKVPKARASQTTESSRKIAGEALRNLDSQVLVDSWGPNKCFSLGPVGAPGTSRFFPSDAASSSKEEDDHTNQPSIATEEKLEAPHPSISTLKSNGKDAKDENINLPAQEERPEADLRGPDISEEAVPFIDQLPSWLDEALNVSTKIVQQESRRRAAIEASSALMGCLDSAEHLERISSMNVLELGELVSRAREEWTRQPGLSSIPFDKVKVDATMRLLAYTSDWAEEMRGLYSNQKPDSVLADEHLINERPLAPTNPFREQHDEVSRHSVRKGIRRPRASRK